MHIKRVPEAWLFVSDVAKAKQFFIETLGFKLYEEHGAYCWFALEDDPEEPVLGFNGDVPEEDVSGHDAEKTSSSDYDTVVTLCVDSYDEAKQELAAKGVTLFGEVAGGSGVPRMISFKDFDGHTFQLVEEKE